MRGNQLLQQVFDRLRYAGWQKRCPVCNHRLRRFVAGGIRNRPNAMCPWCRALERHRLVWLFFQRKTDLFDGNAKAMLHFAPEDAFKSLGAMIGDGYVSADLYRKAMARVDITDIQFPDETFDVIYCSHVLEHVEDDKQAIRELARVLKSTGWALIVVPITASETFEDRNATDPAERLRLFGQADHVRKCGPDYVERLEQNGFRVKEIKPEQVVSERERSYFGLLGTTLYLCRKADLELQASRSDRASAVGPPSSSRSLAGELIVSSRLRNSEAFLRYLCLGMLATADRAHDFLEEIVGYRDAARAHLGDRPSGGLARVELFSLLGPLLTAIVLDSLKPITDRNLPLTMGFTAGYDSRAVRVVLRENRIPAQSYTFGQVGFVDFDLGRLLARRLRLQNRFFDTSELTWSLEKYQQSATKFQDYPISPRVFVEHHLEQSHGERGEIHGYLNGCLTGSMVSESPEEAWGTAVALFCRRNDPFDLQSSLGEDLARSLLPRQALEHSSVLPYARQLDLCFRLFQRVRPLGSANTHFILPFEDGRWIGFWLNRTFDELRGQSLFLSFLQSLDAPEFFDLGRAPKLDRETLIHLRRELLYRRPGAILLARILQGRLLGKARPQNPSGHFNMFTCYANNPSFRGMLRESIARLRGRRVFATAFVDDVVRQFEQGGQLVRTSMSALVSVDIMLELGILPQ